MANTKTKTPQKYISKKSLFLALVAVVLIVGGIGAYKIYQHRVAQDKLFKVQQAEYNAAEADMQKAYDAIVQTVGQPYESKLDKSCGYTAQKYKRGALRCGIEYTFVFTSGDKAGYKAKTLAAANAIHANIMSSKSVTIPYDVNLLSDSYSDYFDASNNMECSFNYSLDNAASYNDTVMAVLGLTRKADAQYVAQYDFSCGNGAVKPVYPVKG